LEAIEFCGTEALELVKFGGRHDGDEMSCGERRRRREDEARLVTQGEAVSGAGSKDRGSAVRRR